MPLIHLQVYINAPVPLCFELSRSIDLHRISATGTGEEAIAGRTTGLIEEGEFVTWRARHLGVTQQLSVRITRMESPYYFRDEMIKGAFKTMWHEHIFEHRDTGTLLTDKFYFEAPLGLLGRLAEHLFLTRYMTRFLQERNRVLKHTAETDDWKKVLMG